MQPPFRLNSYQVELVEDLGYHTSLGGIIVFFMGCLLPGDLRKTENMPIIMHLMEDLSLVSL